MDIYDTIDDSIADGLPANHLAYIYIQILTILGTQILADSI